MNHTIKTKITEAIRRVIEQTIGAQDLCVMQHGEWLGDERLDNLAKNIAQEAAHDVTIVLREEFS